MKIKNKTKVDFIAEQLLELHEYERKQLALILISSTLNEISQKEAHEIAERLNQEEIK